MHQAVGLPGTFVDETANGIRFHRREEFERMLLNTPHGRLAQQAGATPHRVYVADRPDGLLRALTSQDPSKIWRLSVSISRQDGVAVRYPTWDELKVARYRLIPRAVQMAMILPGTKEDYVDLMPFCLQMVEVPATVLGGGA